MNGNWNRHKGGDSPVPGDVRVDVIFKDGREWLGIRAAIIVWPDAPKEYGQDHPLWGLKPDSYNNIIKWRRAA